MRIGAAPVKLVTTGLVLAALAGAACSSGGGVKTTQAPPAASTTATSTSTSTPTATNAVNPADFSARVDHPLFSLVAVKTQEFEGTQHEKGGKTIKTRMEKRVLDQTETVDGVQVTPLEVKEYEDGELVERTLDYFAQHRDGTVWYFGEHIDNYEDGKVKGHEGQWLAGQGKNQPGIYLPATPATGQEFAQEQAPGVAEDRSTILETGTQVTTPAGTFTGCIHVKDFDPRSNGEEFKFYCPKVGIVREEEPDATTDLVHYA